ncbi:MAG: AarF/ABC1/UbiB kinase family protein, partial [Anaerolineae bacterium]|nr:AarF/ABC1/UbiB kinase family protein [Anaerolineae bacterium]
MTLAALKPTHLKRYKDIIRLLMRHGQSDWLQLGGLDQAFIDEEMPPDEVIQSDPEQLARDLEELGPTFVKLGQLLSTRPDLLPQPYLEA